MDKVLRELVTHNAFSEKEGVILRELRSGHHPFVTHRFSERDGVRDFYWGHYHANLADAEADFAERVRGALS